MKISSFSDPNFLKLGLILTIAGVIVAIGGFLFDYPWWIGFRGGLALGPLVIIVYFVIRLKNHKEHSSER